MKYPIGIQQFEKIRKGGFVYVDKTAQVYRLATQGCYYFLSRPRRFGKSLLISTMEAYFLGEKELFKGLALEQLETEWKRYPVLHLDLNADKYGTPDNLDQVLNEALSQWESIYGSNPNEATLSLRFKGVIRRACEQTGEPVVVLVDEYDKPLLSSIDHKSLHDAYRDTLKGFFGVLKSQDKYIRFVFFTGVSPFGNSNVFNNLNNLEDISMTREHADICGFTEKELHVYFEKPIHKLASHYGMTYEKTCEKLREQYGGYHFRENMPGVYNPYSLLNTFDNLEFKDYWFQAGTPPTFLLKLLQKNNYHLQGQEDLYVDAYVLHSVDEDYRDPIPMLFQNGYLTIAGYDPEMGYRLDFPNREVERGFFNFLVPYYTSLQKSSVKGFLNTLTAAVQQGKPDDLLETRTAEKWVMEEG